MPALAFGLAACGTGKEAFIEHGQIELYSPGYPGYNLSVYNPIQPEYEDNLQIEFKIPENNLYFRKSSEDQFSSVITKRIQILKQNPDDSDSYRTVYNDILEDTLITDSPDTNTPSGTYRHISLYSLEPGKYRINTTVTDNSTNKDFSREQNIEIPDLRQKKLVMGQLRLLSLTGDYFRPESGYHLEEGYDSLKSSIQLYIDGIEEQAEFNMRLLKFDYDAEPARLPFMHTPLQGSLQYRGIDYSEPDTLQSVSREISQLEGVVEIEFELPPLDQGNYRLEVESSDLVDKDNDELIYRARDFAVMPEGFPYITEIKEMAQALIYITRAREFDQIVTAENPDTLRKNFEAFFVGLYQNRNMAKNMIRRYFSRVEEANLMFSNHKPGWKTDPGMIYILYGPPDHQERSIDGMVWYYTRDRGMNAGTFIFERSRSTGRAYPGNNYILQRSRYYDRDYQYILDRWRRGQVF